MKPSEQSYWENYLKRLPSDQRPVNAKVCASFAGNARTTDQLIQLYLCGKKTAGSSLLEDYQASGESLPQPGNFWICLDSNSQPKCILKTVRVIDHKFKDVPQEIARAEGEGDLTLAYWRQAHIRFFTRYLRDWGVTNLEETTVITEFFELVHRD